MNIARSGRFVFIVQWILVLVLPIWLAGGRELLGVQTGWMTLVIVMFYWPVLIVALLAPPVVSLFDGEVRRAKAERTGYSAAMAVSWVALFLSAFAVSDVGDDRAYPSALMNWFGMSEGASQTLFLALLALAGLGVFVALALAIAGIVRARRVTPE